MAGIRILPRSGDPDSGKWVFEVWLSLGDLLVKSVEVRGLNLFVDQGAILAVEVSGTPFSIFLGSFNEGSLELGGFGDDPITGDTRFATVTVTVSEAFQVGAALTAAFDELAGFVQFGLSDLSTIEPSALPEAVDVAAQSNHPPIGVVGIEGSGLLGSNLIAKNTLSDSDGIPEAGSGAITYQWRRGSDADLSGAVDADEWQDIDGATQDTYQIDQSDRGSYLSVVAAYVDLGNTSESVASSPVQVWSLLQANPSDTDIPFKLNVQRLTEVFGNGVAVSVDFETGRVWLDDHPEIEEFFDASQLQDLNFSVRNFQGNQTPTSYLSETFYYGQSQKTLIDWTPGDNVYQLPVARDHYFYLPNYELDATLVSVVEDGVLNVQTEYGLTTFYNIGTIIDSRGNDSMVGGDGDDILRASYSSSATVPGMDTYLGGTGDDTFRFEIWADSYNEAGSVYLGDYEDGERIEVQTNGISASNFKDVITVTYDAAADQTTASLLLDGYSIPALFVVDGVREIIPTSYRFNPNAWFPESSFSMYDPSNLGEPTGEVLLVGFPQVGSSLSIQANIKDVFGFGTYQYEWYADDVKLPEYTQAVLPVSETMLGKSVSARISYSDFLGQTRTFSSGPTLINSTPTPDGVVVETSFGDQTARDISATVALLGDDGIGTLTDAIVNKLLNVVDLPQIVGYEVGADSLVLSHTNGSVTYFEDVVFTPASPSAGSATAGRILHDDGDRLELGGRFSFSYDMVAQFFELSSAVDVDYISRTGIGSTQNGSVTFVLSEFQFDESSVSGVVTEVVGYDLSDPAFSYAFSGPISFNTSVSLVDGEPSLTTLLDGNLEQYLFEDTNAKIHYQRPLPSGGPSAGIAFASLFDDYQFSEAGDLFHADQLPGTWDLDLTLDMGAGADSVLIEDGGGAFLTIDTGAGNDRVTLGGDGDVGGIELGEGEDYLELKSLGQFGGNAFYGGNGVDTLKLSFATEDAFEIVTEDAESLIVKYLDTAVQQTFIGFERVEFLDLTPPELISFAVEFSAGLSGQSATLTLAFSEDIQAGAGDLLLKASSGSAFTQIQSIDINGNDVSISGNTLTINTSEVFADWGAYRFFLPTSIVNDLSGNGNASTESNSFYPDIPSPEGSGFAYGQNPLDMSDLFGFYDGTQTFTYTFLDDVNRLVDGFTIPDVFWMQWTESGERFRFSLAGEGFEVDTTGMLVAGLVYGMTLDSNNADNNGYKHHFSLGGSPFSVANWSAALTSGDSSSADNFLAQVLRAADQVTGSAYHDTLLSFEGNDVITGLGGDDFIDGGGGDDKAYFRGNITEYTVSFDDLEQVWVVKDSVLGRDGEDRLKGVEQFVFIDSAYTTRSTLSFVQKITIDPAGVMLSPKFYFDTEAPSDYPNSWADWYTYHPQNSVIENQTDSKVVFVSDWSAYTSPPHNEQYYPVFPQGDNVLVRNVFEITGDFSGSNQSEWQVTNYKQVAEWKDGVNGTVVRYVLSEREANSDYVSFFNETNFWAGADDIVGSFGADAINAHKGADRIQGRGGNDTLTGGAGNDTLDGGTDSDTAVYSGGLSDYTVVLLESGDYRITDQRDSSPDGTDLLSDVEFLVFGNDAPLAIALALNHAPVGTAVSVTTDEDTAKTGTLAGTDVDGDTLTFAKVSDPSHGTVTIETDGSYTYTPNTNYNGTDSFTFKVNDGTVDSVDATVSIAVSAVNDAPVGLVGTVATLGFTGAEHSRGETIRVGEATIALPTYNSAISDSPGYWNNLLASLVRQELLQSYPEYIVAVRENTVILISPPSAGALPYLGFDNHLNTHIGLTLNAPTGWVGGVNYGFNPWSGFVESTVAPKITTLGFTGGEFTAGETVNLGGVSVTLPTYTPAISSNTSYWNAAIAEAVELALRSNEAYDSYIFDTKENTVIVIAPGGVVVPELTFDGINNAHIAMTLNAPSGIVNGIDYGLNPWEQFLENSTSTLNLPEDTSYSGKLSGTDVDGDALTFAKVSDPSHGTVTIETDGSYTYTPSANYNGTDSFTFKVNDGTVDSVDATVSITVSAVNDAPLAPNAFAPLELGRTNKPYTVSTAVLTQGFTDLDGDALSVAAPSVDDGDVALAADGTVTVTPAKNFSGAVNLTYDVIDGYGGEVSVSRKIVYAQKGLAQDGYLANALVWADSDGDGKWTHEAFEDANNNQQVDAGEYVDENGDGEFTAESWAITDAEGGFEGVAGSGDLKIEAWVYNADGSSPTIDLSTGKVFKGSLTAPSGSTVINPLTTLIQSAIASGESADDAQALVRNALGVSAGVDLLNFDPVAQSQSGTDTTEALKVQKAALQVANLMHVAVETTAAAGSSNSKGSISGVANALVSAAKNSTSAGTIDLSSGDLMSSALDAAADEAFKVDQGEEASAEAVTAKAVLKAQAQSIGSALAQVNTSIETIVTQAISAAQTGEAVDTASAMVNIVAAQIVAQEQVTTQAQNSVVASVLSGDTTSAGTVSFSSDEMAQGLSLAKSKVAQVFVAQEGAAPLAVNDQVRMALPGNVSQSRADLTKSGNVLNNDTASFNTKVVKQVGVTAATLQSVPGEGITIAGLYGSLTLQPDGSYTYTEDQTKTQAVAVGGITTDVFTYELGDGSAGDARLDTGTVTIGIDRINVAPIVGIATLKLKEAGVGDVGSGQTTLNLLAQASDADGDTLSTTSVKIGNATLGASGGSVAGIYGTLSLADGVYAYTPDQNSAALQALVPGQTVRETIRYTVGDGYNTVQGTYLVQIEGANDAPTLVAPMVDKRVAEGKTLVFSVPADAFSDVDNAALTYTATLENGEPLPSWLVFDAQDRAFTATPSEAVVGETAETLRIKVSATDAANASVSDTFDLTVKPFGSGYDINATARFWNKPASQSDYAKLAGVTLAVGSESDTSTASGVMALSSVEDTYGEDDGQLILSPTLNKLANKDDASINLSDVIASLKLFLGLNLPDAYRSPYNYVAADLDANGKVELSDVISLLKVFLGLPVANTQAMEWVFVDAAVGAVDNPFNLSKNNASAPLIEHDFAADSDVDLVGIIRGDVDGSWGTT